MHSDFFSNSAKEEVEGDYQEYPATLIVYENTALNLFQLCNKPERGFRPKPEIGIL